MPYCNNCGTLLPDGAEFCSNCAKPQGAAKTGGTVSETQTQSGLSENVAGLLCYVLGWITGLVFFLIDKRPFVRFHAAQSIVIFGGLHIVQFILMSAFGMGMWYGGMGAFSGVWALYGLINLAVLVLWILCMVKAYQHERFRVPIAADIAEKFAGK